MCKDILDKGAQNVHYVLDWVEFTTFFAIGRIRLCYGARSPCVEFPSLMGRVHQHVWSEFSRPNSSWAEFTCIYANPLLCQNTSMCHNNRSDRTRVTEELGNDTIGYIYNQSGKHSATLHTAILREEYKLTFPPLSIARYTFIQLSELGRRGENENAQSSIMQQYGFETRLSRFRIRHFTAELSQVKEYIVTKKDNFLSFP